MRMKAQVRFRDPALTKKIVAQIERLAPPYNVKFCHVCGTHEWTITHYGLRSLLPKTVKVIAGPGCPVCILPAAELDEAISLALEGVTVTTYGDVIRVPASKSSLQEAKASGGDVRVVYSIRDAVRMAANEPDKDFVFLAIGFETTAPATAVEILDRPPGKPKLSGFSQVDTARHGAASRRRRPAPRRFHRARSRLDHNRDEALSDIS